MNRATRWTAATGLAAYLLLPWYMVEEMSFSSLDWAQAYPLGKAGSAFALGLAGAWWLLPLAVPLVFAVLIAFRSRADERTAFRLAVCGFAGFAYLLIEGFAVGLAGWNAEWLGLIFGAPGPQQSGMGVGALVAACALLLLGCRGLAGRGWCRGDAFVVTSVGTVAVLIGLFVFFPVAKILISAFTDNEGHAAPALFYEKITDVSIWGLGCFGGGISCGVAWNTILLAVLAGLASTALGLAFALIATRTEFRFKSLLRVMTVLPIITPPFVIGLALILMFGRSGAVSAFLFRSFGIPPSRWIYGLPGVFLAQTLAFAPIAFLVLVGVVQGISPTLEEAAQTLRAKRLTIFRTVTMPLMRPGLANAFLLCFIESMADFGNPLVIGGNFEVLSTKIFFAVVGAATDQGRAAVLSIVLLVFTLLGFAVQQLWLGNKTYTTVTGKGDAGIALPLPKSIAAACYATAIPWVVLTFAIYAIIFVGGFVKAVGRDYTPTLDSYATAFRIEHTQFGWFFSGSAWPSLFATTQVSLIAAPLTAIIGLLTAYLLARQNFWGRKAFDFAAMLSFAIPGTVVGVSYILAFNVPPIEITGGALILVICFVFRNMPVGVRAGMATLAQIDKSLDEASLTLGARSFTTVMRVMVPLVRPAIVASLIYAFVRAMTAVSAVIFLVSAQYNMSTTYIIGRVDAGEYGLAIAYSSALIVFMLAVILLIERLVGERRLGRRAAMGHFATAPG
ncbi:iron(III) transport system permease protein [Rhizobiales bacterium GAS191]|nr:iron(III) transport system permease protein [Rhizobiales bacterium GAS191]